LSALAAGGQLDEAQTELLRTLGPDTLDADLHTYLLQGEFQVSRHRAPAPLVPSEVPLLPADWARVRCRLLLAAGDEAGARRAADEGLALAPGDERLRLSGLLRLSGEDLWPFVADWLRAAPDGVLPWTLAGAIADDESVSAEAGRRTAGARPGGQQLSGLALVLASMGAYVAAERLATEALAHTPDLASALSIQALALAGLGRWDEAIAAQRQSLQRSHAQGRWVDEDTKRLEALEHHRLAPAAAR
jgi:tetratricopeptide (TPR) repeat protein